jgi:hypothetical protein
MDAFRGIAEFLIIDPSILEVMEITKDLELLAALI